MPMRAVYVEDDVATDWENQDTEVMQPYRDNLNAINLTYFLAIVVSLILVRARIGDAPRHKQDWILMCLQAGRAHPLASWGVGDTCSSPLRETEPPRVEL